MKGLLLFGYLVALLMLGPIVSGFVLCKLWAWFVVTGFGAAQISRSTAIGCALILNYALSHLPTREELRSVTDDKRSDKTKLVEGLLRFVFTPLFALVVGWVFHTFY